MNEAETRAELIDPKLKEDGWDGKANAEVKVHREYPITLGKLKATGGRGKQLTVDYVLSYKGRKLAVVEAKSNELEVAEGVAQAKNYAEKLQLDQAYAANGLEIYHMEMDSAIEYSPDRSLIRPESVAGNPRAAPISSASAWTISSFTSCS